MKEMNVTPVLPDCAGLGHVLAAPDPVYFFFSGNARWLLGAILGPQDELLALDRGHGGAQQGQEYLRFSFG
jgi:hypothetical protein